MRLSRTTTACSIAIAAALLLAASPALAKKKSKRQVFAVKLRGTPPFLDWDFRALVVAAGWGAGAATLELFDIAALEFGGSKSWIIKGHAYDVYVRGGVVYPLLDRRDQESKGWKLQLDGLLGYRRAFQEEGGDYGHEATLDGFTVTAGLDSTYWAHRYFGFTMRLTATYTLFKLKSGRFDDRRIDDLSHAFGLNLSFGFAI